MRTRYRLAGLLALFLLSAACTGNEVVLEPGAEGPISMRDAVRILNDADTGIIAANRSGALSDDLTDTALRVTWQARDYVEANPTTTRARIVTVIQEARDALPAGVNAAISSYIQVAIDALQEVQ